MLITISLSKIKQVLSLLYSLCARGMKQKEAERTVPPAS